MDLIRQSLFNCFLRIITITKNQPDVKLDTEVYALSHMMQLCESAKEMIEYVGVEHNVCIKLVDKEMNMLYDFVKDCATHEFIIRFDNQFELLEDNITITSYFACTSGC